VESANPVLRRRTPNVSIALATEQESSRLNFSSKSGAIEFEVIGSPQLSENRRKNSRAHPNWFQARWFPESAIGLDLLHATASKSNSRPETIQSVLNFERESPQGRCPAFSYAEGGARSGR
jgi:hypothetical protein